MVKAEVVSEEVGAKENGVKVQTAQKYSLTWPKA